LLAFGVDRQRSACGFPSYRRRSSVYGRRDAEKVAWPYALLAGVVLAEIGTFNAYDPYIGGVGMPARIPFWHELPITDFL
jgi:hypothetical protein